MKIPKEYKAIIDPFLKSGEIQLENGGKHTKIVRKDGHKCPMPSTPGDHRAALNFKSQFRRFIAGENILR